MLKIRLKTTAILCGLVTTLSTAFAGTKDGGGGGAFFCGPDKDYPRTYTLMADLWESEFTPFRWPHKTGTLRMVYDNNLSAEEQFAKALAKLAAKDPYLAELVGKEQAELFANKRSLPDNIAITVPDDLKIGYHPRGCDLLGMMYYNGESEQLDVREDLFSMLRTKTDVAAAWMHEAVYKVMRDRMHESTSKLSRRLVGCLFSEGSDCLVAKPLVIPNDRLVYQCASPSYELTFFPKEKITDPKEFLRSDLEPEFYAVVGKMSYLTFGYPIELEFKLKGFQENKLNYAWWIRGGMYTYRVIPTIGLRAATRDSTGNIVQMKAEYYSHLNRTTYLAETLSCRRVL